MRTRLGLGKHTPPLAALLLCLSPLLLSGVFWVSLPGHFKALVSRHAHNDVQLEGFSIKFEGEVSKGTNTIREERIPLQPLAPQAAPLLASTARRLLEADRAKSKVRFMIIIGTEGAGHHMGQVLMPPEAKKILKDADFQKAHVKVKSSLYNQQSMAEGLFTYPCAKPQSAAKTFENTVAALREMERIAAAKMPGGMVVPLNLPEHRLAGMMSYPNFLGPCRGLQWPDLDALYIACDAADVTCSHLLLVRDPYAVVKSTLRRKFEPIAAKQVKLMATMEAVIVAQMRTNSKRLQWCWEYGSTSDVTNLGKALGWSSPAAFRKFFDETYHGKEAQPEAEKALMRQKNHFFLHTQLEKNYQQLLEACRGMVSVNT